MTKLMRVILVLLLVLSLLVCFVACSGDKDNSGDPSDNPTDAPTVPPSSDDASNNGQKPTTPVSPSNPTPDNGGSTQTQTATASQLVSTYKIEALNFVMAEFVGKGTTSIVRYDFAFEVNDKGQITAVLANSMDFGDNNKRTILKEKIAFASPVQVDDIVSGKYNTQRVGGKYTQDKAITFDARENYFKQNLCASLMEKCNVTGGQNFFAEVEKTDDYTKYQLSNTNILTNKTKVFEVTVKNNEQHGVVPTSLGSQEDIKLVSVLEFGDYQVDYLDYHTEAFAPETVEELLTYYPAEVQTALQNNFYAKITKKMFGRSFDESKLVDPEWRIVHEDNKITGFQFITKYAFMQGELQYRLGNVNLAEPIAIKDLSSLNINEIISACVENATCTSEMTFGYLTAEQGKHDDLVNAIFEAKGMGYDAPAGATRYFVKQGARLDGDLGEATQISVLQIENGKATIITLYIKESNGTNLEMIESLKNSKFKIITEQSCEISETLLDPQVAEE